jgi:hypothetical protein
MGSGFIKHSEEERREACRAESAEAESQRWFKRRSRSASRRRAKAEMHEHYQMPTQTPAPWTMPTGNTIAPPTRNPHRRSPAQSTMCVSQAE